MPKDTYGNELLIGPESSFFKDRNEWTGHPKGHFNRDITEKYTGDTTDSDPDGGSRRRRRVRPSRKYKKSAKRVFRKKSRSTRRR